MKQIPMKQFDKVVRLSREYWDEGSIVTLQERTKVAMKIREVTGIDWLAIIDFVDAIIRRTGILPDASDEMIYILLRVLGWEVADNVEEHPAN